MKYLPVLLAFFTSSAFALSTLTLDSRYFSYGNQQYDMRGLPQFGYEITGVRGEGLEFLTKKTLLGDSVFERSLLFFVSEVIGGFVMDQSFVTAYHELGHGSRMAALGYSYHFDSGSREFFSYYFSKLGSGGGYTQSDSRNFRPADTSRFIRGNRITPYASILIEAAGVNASTAYASYLGMKGRYEGAHVSHFASYTWAKLDPVMYPEKINGVRYGDIANMLDSYSDLKVGNFASSDFKNMSLISYALSASTWQYLKAVKNYISYGDMQTLKRNEKWVIPDFESYFTSKGLSMRAISAFVPHEDLSIPFSVEHVFRGRHVTEYSMGASFYLDKEKTGRLTSTFIMGLSPAGRMDYELKMKNDFLLNLGFNLDQLNSLDGERNIISLKRGEAAISPYARLTANF